MAAETPLENLLFDVEDRCGRAGLVLANVRDHLVNASHPEHDMPVMIAALEMVTQELNALAKRALDARTSKAVA